MLIISIQKYNILRTHRAVNIISYFLLFKTAEYKKN